MSRGGTRCGSLQHHVGKRYGLVGLSVQYLALYYARLSKRHVEADKEQKERQENMFHQIEGYGQVQRTVKCAKCSAIGIKSISKFER